MRDLFDLEKEIELLTHKAWMLRLEYTDNTSIDRSNFKLELSKALMEFGRQCQDEAYEKVAAILDSFGLLYNKDDIWNGFKWSEETETKMLEAVLKLQEMILALKSTARDEEGK